MFSPAADVPVTTLLSRLADLAPRAARPVRLLALGLAAWSLFACLYVMFGRLLYPFELEWMSGSILDHVDDSSGRVGDVFRMACDDLGPLAQNAGIEPQALAVTARVAVASASKRWPRLRPSSEARHSQARSLR